MKKQVASKSKKKRISQFEVKEPSELLLFLLTIIKDCNRSKIKSMLTHKQFMVGDKITTKYNHPLKKGDIVKVSWDDGFRELKYQGVKIVFEDEDILVVDKMAGMLSISAGKSKSPTVYKTMLHHVQLDNPIAALFVVHRLDKDASGLMVFAKNKNSQVAFQKDWDKSMKARKYLAVTQGTIEKDENTISNFLRENKALIMYITTNPKDAKNAITHYNVIKKNEFYSLMEIWQETERKNQARVHLKSIGHPIIGDKKYEATENPIGRMALHLKVLTFIHPTTKKEVSFETKVPNDFLKIFRSKYYQ